MTPFALLAQLVEHVTFNHRAAGSSPALGCCYFFLLQFRKTSFLSKKILTLTIKNKKIIKEIKIPIQGGLDPKVLLTDKDNVKKEVEKYLTIFKDHPYVFNLGHGILPETKIDLVEQLIDIVRNYK